MTTRPYKITPESSRPGTHLISLRSQGESLEIFLEMVKTFLKDNPSYSFYGDWDRISVPVGDEGNEHYVAFIKVGE